MTGLYLSPAFSPRSDEEIAFLRTVDGTTGFRLFWADVVKPLLCEIGARRLLEVGGAQGDLTKMLLEYCEMCGGTLIVVEPAVTAALEAIVCRSSRVRLLAEKSAKAIPQLDRPLDAVMLEGDLNHAAVLGDLRSVADVSLRLDAPWPVVFVKNTSWPYARRDMYYDPEGTAPAVRHEHARSGMTPWSAALGEGINAPFANARVEGGPRNGVLTAIEDFIAESSLPLRFVSIPVNHGLGVLWVEGSVADAFIQANLALPPLLRRFLETQEVARLNEILRRLESQRQPVGITIGWRGAVAGALRAGGRRAMRIIEG